jgi:hypothetical protein
LLQKPEGNLANGLAIKFKDKRRLIQFNGGESDKAILKRLRHARVNVTLDLCQYAKSILLSF